MPICESLLVKSPKKVLMLTFGALFGFHLFKTAAIAQTSITLSQPSQSTQAWSVNGTSYTPSTPLNLTGVTNNNVQLTGPSVSGIYTFSVKSAPTVPPGPYTPDQKIIAVPTSAVATVYSSTSNSGLQYNFTSVGGASTGSGVGGLYANNGSDLALNYYSSYNALSFSSSTLENIINVTSTGGVGQSTVINDGNMQSPQAQSAMNGGSVTLTVGPLQGTIGSSQFTLSSTPQGGATLPWLIQSSAISASSRGGAALAAASGDVSRNLTAGARYVSSYPGNGGDGGAVSVTVQSGVSIALGTSNAPVNSNSTAPVVAISATSVGSRGGVCCNDSWGPITVDTPISALTNWEIEANNIYQLGYSWPPYGNNGNGGDVAVSLSGNISGSSSSLYGIVAASVGASTQMPTTMPNLKEYLESVVNLVPQSGLGGTASVSLTSAAITLTGPNSIGVFAASMADQVIIPSNYSVAGSANTAGAVSVTLDSKSIVSIGSSSNAATGGMSAGVVAISSTGWSFQPTVQPTGAAPSGVASAGNGGPVTISNAGTISASGNSAFGVVALSLGNGGILGNGVTATSSVNYLSGSSSGAVQSNSGGTVTITNSGIISTNGNAAIGVIAASNGSGGLIAAIPNAQFGQTNTDKATSIIIGTPSSGYIAGLYDSTYTAPGGVVQINNTGTINTGGGVGAIGLMAQSVGGGGASFTGGVALSIGDAGGAGGNGGLINITNSGSIATSGDGSFGILAQSIGGGGGHAANTNGLFVALGGRGGSGGNGGHVSVALQPLSSIATTGDFSTGIVMQSIGGGGGNGGFGKAIGVFVGFGIGGVGGAGGAGGNVSIADVGANPNFSTSGSHSHGLVMQSIGGGGGMGGHAYSQTPGVVFAGAVAVGGSGGTAGNGGTISSCAPTSTCEPVAGTISTSGSDSFGVLLQTIGGGGGYGGGASAKSYATSAGDIPAISVSVGVGGAASNGANAGDISFTSMLQISTANTGSYGILAQSIGGGGGVGADSTSGANSYNASDDSVSLTASVGGNGGGGGNGGNVTLTTGATISTVGHNASAVLAHSVGGGGGIAGMGNAFVNDVSLGTNQYSLALAVGGNGGSGGAGGTVNVTNNANITTIGTQSSGLVVQSISGGGGYAGNSGAQGAAGSGGNHALAVVLGGNAGGGYAGGAVRVNNTGNITTGRQLDLASSLTNALTMSQPIVIGGDSHGILAQSIGGGGGIGGNADPTASLIGSVQGLLNGAAAAWVGGSANVQWAASKLKGSDNGSGSGTGSDDDPKTDPAIPINYNATVAVGGKGGAGGAGGTVSVQSSGAITTYGHRSYGIVAQSIGGGGGIGGASTSSSNFLTGSASATLTGGITLGLGINVGGKSGSGGDGGAVTITTNNSMPLSITTAGYASIGVLAQSIGGGGGIGHDGSVFSPSASAGTGVSKDSIYTTPTVNLGSVTNGSPGVAGSGGNVAIGTSSSNLFSANVVTLGDDSSAIFAQSIGGGGGHASVGCTNSANGTNGNTAPSACYLNVHSKKIGNSLVPSDFIGGLTGQAFNFSANGGNTASQNIGTGAGTISVYADLDVTTYGNRSMGIVTQSITGGGGFISAPNQIINSVVMPSQPRALNSSPGGQTINLTNSTITTLGNGAWGVFAQMVQGGGGFFGDPSQNLAFNVKYSLDDNAARNVFAASSGVAVTQIAQFQKNQIADVHSWNYSSCVKGPCTITDLTPGLVYKIPYTNGTVPWNAGDYVTIAPSLEQANPYKIKQHAANGSVTTEMGTGSIVYIDPTSNQFFLIGSDGKTGVLYSPAGTAVQYEQKINWSSATASNYSDVNNLFLSSYGGALGTVSGMSMLVNINNLATTNSNLGWTNSPMMVSLDQTQIQTFGVNAHGLVLQNLGAVGGIYSENGILKMGVTLHGNNAAGNTPGGQVNLSMTASSIEVFGDGSRGVVIQSDGGGPGGTANQGIVSVGLKQNSSITSSHHTSVVLLGSSYSANNPSTISVDATSSIIRSDFITSSTSQAVDNTEGAYNNWAIYAPTGYTHLTNAGAITGNILLGIVTPGEFTNTGSWQGSTAFVANNSLHNYGSIYPAGRGATGVLYIHGSLKHHAGGEIHVDVDPAGKGPTNDVIRVNGLARIEGNIVPQTKSLMPRSYEVLTANSLEHTGSARNSHIFSWLTEVNGGKLTISPKANFSPSGVVLNGSHVSLANHLQRGWDSAEQSLAKLFGYLHGHEAGSHRSYQLSLNELNGQTLNAQPVQFRTAFSTYLGEVLSCPTVTQQQDDCVWGRLAGDITTQSSTETNPGYHSAGGGMRVGTQRSLGNGWSSGFGVGYGANRLTSTNFSSNGQFFDLSVSSSKEIGQWRFGGSLGFAQGWFNNNRNRTMAANGAADSMSGMFTSQSRMTMAGLRMRAAYEHVINEDHYLKPYVDLDLVYSNTPGYSETGAGPLGLSINSNNSLNLAITPMLEYGFDAITQDASRVKFFVRAGASFLPNNNYRSQVSFQGLSANLGGFNVSTDGPDVLGRMNLGMSAFNRDNMEMTFQYGLLAGQSYISQNLSANLIWRF